MPSEDRVRVGRIPYANLFPIFSMLDEAPGSPRYEFVYGVPSLVNRLLREGEVDVSPSSSIEYLRREDAYVLMEGHSISSFGPIGSILLFSKRPIETLDGLTVLTTSQSETSVALLAVTLKKFYDCDCSLRLTDAALPEAIQSSPACLLIGDDALREALKWPRLHIYDLGDTLLLVNVLEWFVGDLSNVSQRVRRAAATGPLPANVNFDRSRSYLESLKAFPKNVNLRSTLTFRPQQPAPLTAVPDGRFITVSVHTTLAELPPEIGDDLRDNWIAKHPPQGGRPVQFGNVFPKTPDQKSVVGSRNTIQSMNPSPERRPVMTPEINMTFVETYMDVEYRQGEEWAVRCPIHGERHASMRVNVEKILNAVAVIAVFVAALLENWA